MAAEFDAVSTALQGEATTARVSATSSAATVGTAESLPGGTDLAGQLRLELMRQLAHDLRSPVGSILLLTDALQTGHSGPLTPLQQRQLELIHRAASNLIAFIDEAVRQTRADRYSQETDSARPHREDTLRP